MVSRGDLPLWVMKKSWGELGIEMERWVLKSGPWVEYLSPESSSHECLVGEAIVSGATCQEVSSSEPDALLIALEVSDEKNTCSSTSSFIP
nr:hypothetical protein Itr_chr02CG22740 [Ipomoea trifida]